MAVLEADFVTDLTPAEGGDMLWSLPIVAPAREPLDWASLLEEAEARVKEERGPRGCGGVAPRGTAPVGERCPSALRTR